MALATGTLQISDALVLRLREEFGTDVLDQNVLDVGVERLTAAIRDEIAAHNRRTRDMTGLVAVRTTERIASYGVSGGGDMIETDEFARVPTQKGARPSPVAFPLRQWQFALGWTYQFFRKATIRDMLVHLGNAQIAHRRKLLERARAALFGATNYTFSDYTGDGVDLAVKRLVNADGAPIPLGPNAEEFNAATHTHYDAIDWSGANAAQREAAVNALVYDVVEHGHTAGNVLYLNMGDEAKVRALDGFEAYLPVQIAPGTSEDFARGRLNTSNPTNRAIGVLTESGAEVWVKPWVPVSYMFSFAAGDPMKPLAERVMGDDDGLSTVAQNDAYPLYAQYMMAEFDFGAYTRTNGAVLYLGGGTYTEPS